MSSLRGGTHTTGRPVRRAAAATTVYSAWTPALPPKPPPTWGVTTRISAGSIDSAAASWPCRPCGICVDAQNVSRPASSTSAAQQSGSIGTTAMRWLTYRPRTTTSEIADRSVPAGLSTITIASFEP
jgi:hypothetical protein